MTHATQPSPVKGFPDIRASDPVAAPFPNYSAASITIWRTVEHLWTCRNGITKHLERTIFDQSLLKLVFRGRASLALPRHHRASENSVYATIASKCNVNLQDGMPV